MHYRVERGEEVLVVAGEGEVPVIDMVHCLGEGGGDGGVGEGSEEEQESEGSEKVPHDENMEAENVGGGAGAGGGGAEGAEEGGAGGGEGGEEGVGSHLLAALSYWCQGKPGGCWQEPDLGYPPYPGGCQVGPEVTGCRITTVRWPPEPDYNSRWAVLRCTLVYGSGGGRLNN